MHVSAPLRRTAARTARRALNTLILGPPGGGKGTISKRMVRDYGFVHVSTGDALRAHVRDGTALGAEAKTYMDAGKYVPDAVIIGLVEAELEGKTGHLLLDGFPRTVAQVRRVAGIAAGVDVLCWTTAALVAPHLASSTLRPTPSPRPSTSTSP